MDSFNQKNFILETNASQFGISMLVWSSYGNYSDS